MKRMLAVLAVVISAAVVQVAQGNVAFSDPFVLKSGSGGRMSAALLRFLSRSHTSKVSDCLPTFDSDHNVGLLFVIW